MIASPTDSEVLRGPTVRRGNLGHGVLRAARRNPVGALAGSLVLFLIFMAICGPWLAPYSADNTTFARLTPPSLSHPFGTDNLFRDIFSRIIIGARNSLGIAFASVFLSTIVGVVLGLTSGFFGGKWDLGVSRLIDVVLSIPPLVFTIFFLTVFQPSYWTIIAAIAILLTPGTARIVRGSTLGILNLQYIEAAFALGSSPTRIMARHILPNVAAPVIVIASVQLGTAILVEATISFLGLGISSAANPSWGRMLQETRTVWQAAWWTSVIPGLAISSAVLALNIFGDALRDALDPSLRTRH